MVEQTHFELIVIGTGPGGEGASMCFAKSGKPVAAIERFEAVGGGATHWGTIPSKALRAAIYHMHRLHQSPIYKRLDVAPEVCFPDLLKRARHVVEEQAELRQGFYDHNHVPLIPGAAKFIDDRTIEVTADSGASRKFTADAFVIATGSAPYRPADIDFGSKRIFDSDTLLDMQFTPGSIIVYGAGVIGCEYASMLRVMGAEVTLINTRPRLLEFLDDEISDALSYHFCDCGIEMLHPEEYESVQATESHVVVQLNSGKRLKCDAFVWCQGRSGNTANLGLENIGVKPTSRGLVEVDESFRLKGKEKIYAVGDVIGPPSLASAAYDQGRFAASHVLGEADYRLVQDIPSGIYTTPEISSVGKTEKQLTEAKVPYAVGKAPFKTLARAQITGQTVGMLKLLFHRETLALLGIHCFGESAAEIVHIGQAIMGMPKPHNTINYFVHTTFNYPTMAEAYRVAALRGLEQVF
jgi:NAD(P) transhydrogenase